MDHTLCTLCTLIQQNYFEIDPCCVLSISFLFSSLIWLCPFVHLPIDGRWADCRLYGTCMLSCLWGPWRGMAGHLRPSDIATCFLGCCPTVLPAFFHIPASAGPRRPFLSLPFWGVCGAQSGFRLHFSYLLSMSSLVMYLFKLFTHLKN